MVLIDCAKILTNEEKLFFLKLINLNCLIVERVETIL